MIHSTPLSLALKRYFHQPVANDLCVKVPSVSLKHTNAEVLEVFGQHRDLISLPVVQDERPMGIISRNTFMSQMSKPYHREIYEKKSCMAFIDKEPLVVDAETTIEDLAVLAVESGDKTLAGGFLIVKEGKLQGLGSGLDLMRMMVEVQSEKNRQVMYSIDYASVIQRSLLSTYQETMRSTLKDACLVWEPRDIVGGDFYHFERFDEGWFAAVADCTGHGVPGAFLTLIASSILGQTVTRLGPHDPALIMSEVNRGIKQVLGQQESRALQAGSDEGLDAILLWMNTRTGELTYASARTPMFVLTPDSSEAQVLNGDRRGLGYVGTPSDLEWKNHKLVMESGTVILATTDGVIDQIGGSKHISFGKKRVAACLQAQRDQPMDVLAEVLMAEHKAYQGQHQRRDDLTFFGVRFG